MEWILPVLPPLACGFVVGFLIYYSGVGGGALIIPALIVLFGVAPSVAVGTASVYAAATKIFAGAGHWRDGNVNIPLCLRFSAFAAPGVLCTAPAVGYFSQTGAESFQDILRYLIAAAIILSLIAAQFRPPAAAAPRFLPPTAFAVGALMGATGVGGGVLIAPALLLLSGETPKRVVGASIVIALALSALTAVIYAGGGQINYHLALWMAAGSLLAVAPAARVLRASSQRTVRRTLHILIVAALLLMLRGE
ncbi:MAG: sulfite exporter TauE/SafE family protein [Gammaproteobacteria bacterium]